MKQDERCTRCGGEIFPNAGEQWPDGWIHSEPNNCYLTALARAEAAEALAYERLEDMLFAEQRATDADLRAEAAEAEAARLAARVADLEAQLAEQGWRPVTEKPDKPGWYVVYDSDGHVFYNADIFPYRVARWTGKWDSAFNGLVDYWRPLPPAAAEATE